MGQTIKQGKASATFDQDIDQLFTGLLDTVAPNARLIMDQSLRTIETEAVQQWPRRKPTLIRGEGGRIVKSIETSKNLISVSNTGPTSLIKSNGRIDTLLKPNKELVQLVELELNGKKTLYTLISNLPMIAVILISLICVLRLRKYG